jgi:hypothetical protein
MQQASTNSLFMKKDLPGSSVQTHLSLHFRLLLEEIRGEIWAGRADFLLYGSGADSTDCTDGSFDQSKMSASPTIAPDAPCTRSDRVYAHQARVDRQCRLAGDGGEGFGDTVADWLEKFGWMLRRAAER